MTSEKDIDSGDQTTPDNLADTEEIKCICGISDDDGYTIQCDNCYTWQHINCVRADPEVKEYKCYNCSDINVDKLLKDSKKTKKEQKARNEAESRVYPSASQMGELSTTSTNKPRSISSSGSYSKDYRIIDKNIIASKAVEELFPKIYSQYQAQHRKRSMSLSSTSKTDNEHNREDNQEPSATRSTSSSLEIGNPFMMEKESLARPLMKTIVKPVNQPRSKMHKKHFNCYGLFAETTISSGLFIIEFKGEVCLKSDYKANENNQYSLLGVTQPFVLFYPVLNLCVDARRVGTEARFIRRSCYPNAETRTIVVPGFDEQQVHLGIFAKSDISKGKEITIGWDWESNHIASSLMQDSIPENEDDKKRDEIGKIAAAILRLTECACENKDNCIIYKTQNEGKALGKPRKKRGTDAEEILIKETSPEGNEEVFEDDMEVTQKKRDNVSSIRKINRKGKQNAERLSESSLNGNNKNTSDENEAPIQIGRKVKKKTKEIGHSHEETGNIRRKSRKSEKLIENKHARSSSKTESSKRRLHEDEEGQQSESSLSSVNTEMFIDDDFLGTSVTEVTSPGRNNTDKNNPNEQINRKSNEDQLSVSYDPSVNHSIETPDINDISRSSANPSRPLPPAISGIPFKDYLILMHEWKKAIETVSTSTSSENPSSSALNEPNIEMTSEYIESSRYKGLNNSSNEFEMDPIMSKDAKIDLDEGLVPLPTPIIPAKRVASSPSPTLNNSNGKILYNENGSDVKGKRQKTEELQNLSKGKGKEIEIENEGVNFSQNDNVQSLTSDNRDNFESTNSIKTSGDLKKQAINSLNIYNSANEISKTTTKISLDEYLSQKSIAEDSKSLISSVTDNDKKDNKTIESNDGTSAVNTSTKTKPPLKELQDKSRLAEFSNVDALKKSTDLISITTEQKSDVIENEQIIEQAKSDNTSSLTVVNIPPKSPPPKTSTAEDNNIASHSSLINDGYFPEVDLPLGFSIAPSKDIDSFNTNDYGRHTNSNHSDGSYEETRGRHSPSYKDYSSIKSSGNYNSSYNMPLCDTSMQTSPRPEHMSPPRGPRYYGGHFRGNRMGGPYRGGMSMSPGDRGRYHSGSGYFNSAGSLPATPRQGAQSSIMSSSASSPYDPANPDGQSSNISNERDSALDNSNIVGNNSGGGITMESKTRDYARSGGERSDLRERWNYGGNYFAREREWRERERDDGRKDWNNKRLDHHYRERESYPIMTTRRPSSGPHQDRYTMIGGSVPTGPAAGLNSSPSGISKSNEQSSSSNNPPQRFGVDDHRRNRR